eukprot:scaffold163923_cov21-Tisochrysis_lutea.AAC.1
MPALYRPGMAAIVTATPLIYAQPYKQAVPYSLSLCSDRPALHRLEKAAIAAATPLTYAPQELLLL